MRVYLRPPQPSRGLERIADALRWYLPEGWMEAESRAEADLVVLYAIGRAESLLEQARRILGRGDKYAVIQVCLKSTQKPDPYYWVPLWRGAAVVWSYYDLQRVLDEDGRTWAPFTFYHAPLGADPAIFYPRTGGVRGFTILSTGLSRLSESVRECWLAANAVNGSFVHLGPLTPNLDGGFSVDNLNDDDLATVYSNCEWVSALRRKEGFELPGIEGLLCGARPITFDTPDYRWCYGDHAEYVREGTRQEVVDQLVKLFKRGPRPVTEDEIGRARERYDWAKIVGGFYERIQREA